MYPLPSKRSCLEGYCTIDATVNATRICSPAKLGYHLNISSPAVDHQTVSIGSNVTNLLIVHFAILILTGALFLMACSCGVAMAPVKLFFGSILWTIALALDLTVFHAIRKKMNSLDISYHINLGIAFWLLLAPIITYAFGVLLVCCGCKKAP
ncbi:hypothetical protein BDZ97DRAFT_1158788 [Flammula alnicola]|nr:hypothetical protein BDZ97DRAFT_1158788 [Flammula alnicola]